MLLKSACLVDLYPHFHSDEKVIPTQITLRQRKRNLSFYSPSQNESETSDFDYGFRTSYILCSDSFVESVEEIKHCSERGNGVTHCPIFTTINS
jgi:exonuclease III